MFAHVKIGEIMIKTCDLLVSSVRGYLKILIIYSASSKSVPLRRSIIKMSLKITFLVNVFGFFLTSSTLIESDGKGVEASSFLIKVLINLWAFMVLFIAKWSLRKSSNKLCPTRLFAPVMKIRFLEASNGDR